MDSLNELIPIGIKYEILKKTKEGWKVLRRYRRFRIKYEEMAEGEELRSGKIDCPGCHKKFTLWNLNISHECRAGVEQPEGYVPEARGKYIRRGRPLGSKMSDETKEKMRQAKLGVPKSEEHKNNLRLAHLSRNGKKT